MVNSCMNRWFTGGFKILFKDVSSVQLGTGAGSSCLAISVFSCENPDVERCCVYIFIIYIKYIYILYSFWHIDIYIYMYTCSGYVKCWCIYQHTVDMLCIVMKTYCTLLHGQHSNPLESKAWWLSIVAAAEEVDCLLSDKQHRCANRNFIKFVQIRWVTECCIVLFIGEVWDTNLDKNMMSWHFFGEVASQLDRTTNG